MDLCICTVINMTVFVMVDAETGHNSTWAEHIRYTINMWESIQPKGAVVDELDDHEWREALEQ